MPRKWMVLRNTDNTYVLICNTRGNSYDQDQSDFGGIHSLGNCVNKKTKIVRWRNISVQAAMMFTVSNGRVTDPNKWTIYYIFSLCIWALLCKHNDRHTTHIHISHMINCILIVLLESFVQVIAQTHTAHSTQHTYHMIIHILCKQFTSHVFRIWNANSECKQKIM